MPWFVKATVVFVTIGRYIDNYYATNIQCCALYPKYTIYVAYVSRVNGERQRSPQLSQIDTIAGAVFVNMYTETWLLDGVRF
jgi:hypothetical protein